jgi:tRNA (guanine-N7-)-methyltransferase
MTRPDTASHLHPRVNSYRSRRSTVSSGQQQTWDRLWPELGMQARSPEGPAEDLGAPRVRGLLDTQAWFGRSAPVVLEIGSGTGISTLAMAKAEPHIDVVAVEVYRRGLAQLLSAIAREGVPNIRLVRGDGVDVLEHMFSPESLAGVRVFFPTRGPRRATTSAGCCSRTPSPLIADRLRPAVCRTPPPTTPATPNRSPSAAALNTGYAASHDDSLPISVARPMTARRRRATRAARSRNWCGRSAQHEHH